MERGQSFRENFKTKAILVCSNFSVYAINVVIPKTRKETHYVLKSTYELLLSQINKCFTLNRLRL